MTEPSSTGGDDGDPRSSTPDPESHQHPHAAGSSPTGAGPRRTTPRRLWDLTRTALAGGGLLVIALAVTATGPWFPLGHTELDSRTSIFGLLALVVLIAVQGASLAYLSGRWRSIWGWVIGGVVVVGGALVGLQQAQGLLPDSLGLPIPRTAILVAGVLMLVVALSRDSDTVHERETDPDDWFKVTGRILQAVHFWTGEQAAEQMRRARAEFDRAQSRRGHGDPELTPTQVFGPPDEYAASLRQRPPTSSDPLRAGRWYYLSTAIALGTWAVFRSLAVATNWLTVVLFVFAVVAFAMFVWASLVLHRHR